MLETHGYLTPQVQVPCRPLPSCPHLWPPEWVPKPRAMPLLTVAPALLAVGLFLAGYGRSPALHPRLCQLGIRVLSFPLLLCHVRTFQALTRKERLSCGSVNSLEFAPGRRSVKIGSDGYYIKPGLEGVAAVAEEWWRIKQECFLVMCESGE